LEPPQINLESLLAKRWKLSRWLELALLMDSHRYHQAHKGSLITEHLQAKEAMLTEVQYFIVKIIFQVLKMEWMVPAWVQTLALECQLKKQPLQLINITPKIREEVNSRNQLSTFWIDDCDEKSDLNLAKVVNIVEVFRDFVTSTLHCSANLSNFLYSHSKHKP